MSARRIGIVTAALAALLVFDATFALAAPTASEKRAQAERARTQVAALDEKVETASEDYNESADRYAAVTKKAEAARTRLAQVSGRLDQLEVRLGSRAEHMYRSGPLSFLEVLLGATDFEQFATVWDVLTEMNRDDASMVAELKTAKAEAASARAELDSSQEQAAAEFATMKARKTSIEEQLAERERLLRGLESEVKQLESEERAREAAAAAASKKSWKPPSFSVGGNPKRQPRSEVVNIAKRYLGVPYKWAGASPSTGFDCSGFTMYVYAQVGVRLPHSSRAQYGVGERVSRANLKPGDLVFFGRSRIHHVGIYVGGGDYIHSPRTGDVVKISSLGSRSDFVGGCRP